MLIKPFEPGVILSGLALLGGGVRGILLTDCTAQLLFVLLMLIAVVMAMLIRRAEKAMLGLTPSEYAQWRLAVHRLDV